MDRRDVSMKWGKIAGEVFISPALYGVQSSEKCQAFLRVLLV
jgi:hypothetical protein